MKKINLAEPNKFELIKPLTWEDVFSIWENNEATDPSWVRHATKSRGFSSWQDWRQSHANKLILPSLNWALYKLSDNTEIPNFHAGPFGAWAKHYNGKNSISFLELIKIPAVLENKRLKQMINNFPKKLNMIAVRKPSGIIVIIEGTHRCLAYAYLLGNKNFQNSDVKIALAEYPREKLALVSQIK